MMERHQFVRLFDNPKSVKKKFFQAYWKTNDIKNNRIGITLKGKTTSVCRNKIKRLIREWFRSQYRLQIKNEFIDLNIVIPLPKEMTFKYLEALSKELYGWK